MIKPEQALFLLFLFCKPFYFLPSGSFQIGDSLLVFSFLVFAIKNRKNKLWGKWIWQDKEYLFFAIGAVFINQVCYLGYGDSFSLFAGAYILYNYLVIVLFRRLASERRFLQQMEHICRLNLWIQCFLLVSGWGRYRFEHRYVGSFQDPNQMAFFVFAMLLLIYIIRIKIGEKKEGIWLDIFLSGILIYCSKSVGAALGFFIFFICFLLSQRKWKGVFLVAVSVGVLFLFLFQAQLPGDSYHLFYRIQEKLYKIQADGISNFLSQRGIDRIWLYPWYLLWGAGDGAYTRFSKSWLVFQELHSTLPQLWFCYGAVPFFCILCWLYQNIKNVLPKYVGVYLSLFVESFVLVNSRQPFFWMILLLGKNSLFYIKQGENNGKRKKRIWE